MKDIDHIYEKIGQCDDQIIAALAERMSYIEEIVEITKAKEIPIFQSQQEEEQVQRIKDKIEGHIYQDEIQNIFQDILENSRKIQRKGLFSYNLMLIGFMGTGKSSVSRYLSKMLAMEEVEVDDIIAKKEGMSINQIFQQYGEDYFRNCESNTLIELQEKSSVIVSCGGGAVLRPENVAHMKKNGRIVLLTASPETIFNRVRYSKERPILNHNMNVDFIKELMEKRREKYESAADVVIHTDYKSIEEIGEELIKKLITSR